MCRTCILTHITILLFQRVNEIWFPISITQVYCDEVGNNSSRMQTGHHTCHKLASASNSLCVIARCAEQAQRKMPCWHVSSFIFLLNFCFINLLLSAFSIQWSVAYLFLFLTIPSNSNHFFTRTIPGTSRPFLCVLWIDVNFVTLPSH